METRNDNLNMTPDDHLMALGEKLRSIKLDAAERATLQRAITAYVAEHPPVEVRTSLAARQLPTREWSPSLLTLMLRPMAIALALILFVGGGTSLAAERSVPGDALYTMKIEINERVRGALAVSEQAEAGWQATLVARRLDETVVLAARNELSADVATTLTADVEKHVDAATARADRLEAKGNVVAASAVRSNLEAYLDAHATVLERLTARTERRQDRLALRLELGTEANESLDAEIAEDSSATATLKNGETVSEDSRDRVAANVRSRANAATTARLQAEERLAVNADTKLAAAARAQQKIAADALRRAELTLTRSASLAADVRTEIDAKLGAAAAANTEAKMALANESYALAFAKFQEAARLAQETKLIVRVTSALQLGALSSEDEPNEVDDEQNTDDTANEEEDEDETENEDDESNDDADNENSNRGASTSASGTVNVGIGGSGVSGSANTNGNIDLGL